MILRKNNKGFTLIELMITVAIVGILAAVALPAYQDYTIRAQVTEGLSLASGAKVSVYEYYAMHGVYPTSNAQLGYSGASGKYVSEVNIGNGGIIVATFGGEANEQLKGKRVILDPLNTGGAIEITSNSFGQIFASLLLTNNAFAQETSGWHCFSDAPPKYLPSSCQYRQITGGNDNPVIEPPVEEPTEPEVPEVPAGPPIYNVDTNYTFFNYQGGKMLYNGNELTLLSTSPDGTQLFGDAPGYGSATFELKSDGSMTHILFEQNRQTFYPSQEGGGYITYDSFYADGQMTSIITPGGQTGPYAGSTFSTFKPFTDASARYKNGLISTAQYKTALSNFQNQVREVATNNGGSFPQGFPPAFIQLLDVK